MDSVIITGANGFIGRNLIRLLIQKDIEVTAISINNDNLGFTNGKKVIEIKSDMKNMDALYNLIPKKEYQCFYHFAWNGVTGSKRADYNIQINNVKLTCDAALLSKRLGCKKFVTSGTITEKVAEESLKYHYTSENLLYGLSKLYAHKLLDVIAKKNDINYIWAQLSNIYGGDNQNGNLISYTLKEFSNNRIPVYGPCEQPYDFASIDDIINLLFIIGFQSTIKNEYFLGSGSPRKLKEYLYTISEIFGKEIAIGIKEDDGIKYDFSWFDTSALREFNYEYKETFEEAMHRIKMELTKE